MAPFGLFRGLTEFGDLPLGQKLVRLLCFPYFIVIWATAPPPVGALPQRYATASRALLIPLVPLAARPILLTATTAPARPVESSVTSLHALPPLERTWPKDKARGRSELHAHRPFSWSARAPPPSHERATDTHSTPSLALRVGA